MGYRLNELEKKMTYLKYLMMGRLASNIKNGRKYTAIKFIRSQSFFTGKKYVKNKVKNKVKFDPRHYQ